MTKTEIESLTRQRIKEAKLLLDNRYYNGAYYLAGYALEFALKSCILKNIRKQTIPERSFLNNFYTHDLFILLKTAGVETAKNTEATRDSNFDTNWRIVKDWNESSRYKTFTKAEATQLYLATTQKYGGVLRWIQQYW